jgi:hypothetical protein
MIYRFNFMNTKQQLLHAIKVSELRDRFAAAVITGLYCNYRQNDSPSSDTLTTWAFEQADSLIEKSETPKLLAEFATITQNEPEHL